jgi:CPA2 family monovalent cation:H+ antiporter-2
LGESLLLVNLVIALIAALIGAIIAVRLGQSIILGYILAGVFIGPFTPGVEGDLAIVEALAEIGIVLLLFAIGVQFSLGDLLHAGKVAVIGSTLQVVLTVGVGFGFGMAVGWQPLESLFFGAVLSNSSSTVLSKVLGERGEMDTGHGKLALAWSTVQDLSTIILIVVLSALATDSDALLLSLGIEVGKAALFLVLLVPIGLRVLPWFFERVVELRSRELFVLTVGVVALGLAYSATFFGLSLALGAFVVGVVVSESDLSHQILGEVLPLRDIFAGLFFVSVGMLVDPGFVVRTIPLVLLTLAVIVFFKGALSAALAWLLGTPTRTAILTGTVLAQSAEFSFLLAQVGRDLDAISSTVFSLMLAAAAVSIVLSPTIHRVSLPLADALHGRRLAFRSDAMAQDVLPDDVERLRGHAVICGYGRVGSVIGHVLRNRFTFVVIEEDLRIVAMLRGHNTPVIRGNAAVPEILAQAHIEHARELVIALPDPVVTRQVVDQARRINPRIRIIVRTHSETERQWLIRRNVNVVVLGEWELALEIAVHALRGFGVSKMETDAVIQRLRHQGSIENIRRDLATPGPIPRAPADGQSMQGDPIQAERVTRRLHDGVRFRSESCPDDARRKDSTSQKPDKSEKIEVLEADG